MQMHRALLFACALPLFAPAAGAQMPPPAPIAPPIPRSILSIEGVLNGKLAVKNNSQRSIAAWAIQTTGPTDSPHYSDMLTVDRWNGPLQPGATDDTASFIGDEVLPQNLESQVRVVVVIFADGTHMGHAATRANQGDILAQIFGARKACADELARWSSILAQLPADDHAAITEFLAKVDVEAASLAGPHNVIENQRVTVFQGIKNIADQTRAELQKGAHDESWIRTNVLSASTSDLPTQLTINKAVATDNGEARVRR